MFLKHLELKNFRNYGETSLDLGCGLILFLGNNGAGKTNLLESVYYLSNGKSHRSAVQGDLIKRDCGYSIIRGLIESGGEDKLIEIQLNDDNSLKIKLNGVFIKSKSGFISKLATVIFSPDDLKIIKSSPFYRRNYLDDILEKVDNSFLSHKIRYQKILNQRNSLLKSISGINMANSNSTIEVWNEKLIESGGFIIEKRLGLLEQVRKGFIKYLYYFFPGRKADIRYVHSWERSGQDSIHLIKNTDKDPDEIEEYQLRKEDVKASRNEENEKGINPVLNSNASNKINIRENILAAEKSSQFSAVDIEPKDSNTADSSGGFITYSEIFKDKLDYYFKKDVALKTTTIGPHRDDMVINLDSSDIRNFGSQGQQRIAAICLKLVELDILAENIDEKPMLLLDDVLSELDLERKHLLLKLIGNNFQTFITAANFDYLKDLDLKFCEKYLVENDGIQKY
jgi:DNA replication and repair protein RecF